MNYTPYSTAGIFRALPLQSSLWQSRNPLVEHIHYFAGLQGILASNLAGKVPGCLLLYRFFFAEAHVANAVWNWRSE